MTPLHELINPQLLGVGVGTLGVIYTIKLFINYRNTITSFNYLPGCRAFLSQRTRVFASASEVEVLQRPRGCPKPLGVYEVFSLFGINIIATEHDEWRKHRKVASPAFNERNNALVFHETTRVVMDLFQMWQEHGMSL
jgi:cytochrome P450